MAVDGGYGPKGYPKFDPLGAPELNVDDEAVGQYAAKVGNRRAASNAVRNTLSTDTTTSEQRWTGLEFFETDTGRSFLHRAAGWDQVMQANFEALAPAGELGDAFPSTTDDPLIRIGYGRFAPLNASGGGTLVFPKAFPNRCAFLVGITIEGSASNPVVSSQNLQKTGATLVWANGANTTVRFLYLAIGF